MLAEGKWTFRTTLPPINIYKGHLLPRRVLFEDTTSSELNSPPRQHEDLLRSPSTALRSPRCPPHQLVWSLALEQQSSIINSNVRSYSDIGCKNWIGQLDIGLGWGEQTFASPNGAHGVVAVDTDTIYRKYTPHVTA